MSPHASSDIVILITYLHNGINTAHYRAATSLLHCIPDTLRISLLIPILSRLQDKLLHHFMAGILLKEAEPGFISDFFWRENPSFFNCGHFLWRDWCWGYWTIFLRPSNLLTNLVHSRQQTTENECVWCDSQCILISAWSGLDSWSKVIKYWY